MQSGGMKKDEFDACYGNLDNENLILEGVMAAQKEGFVLMTVERPRLCYGIKGNLPQTIWMMLLEICHILVKEGNSNKSDICWANETLLLFKNITYVGSSKHFVLVGVFSLSLSAALLSPDDA